MIIILYEISHNYQNRHYPYMQRHDQREESPSYHCNAKQVSEIQVSVPCHLKTKFWALWAVRTRDACGEREISYNSSKSKKIVNDSQHSPSCELKEEMCITVSNRQRKLTGDPRGYPVIRCSPLSVPIDIYGTLSSILPVIMPISKMFRLSFQRDEKILRGSIFAKSSRADG